MPEGDIALTDSHFTGTSTKDFKTERDVKLSSKLPAELNNKVVLLTPCERVLQVSWMAKTHIGFSRINLLNWRNDEVKIVGDIPLSNISLGQTRACRTRKKKRIKVPQSVSLTTAPRVPDLWQAPKSFASFFYFFIYRVSYYICRWSYYWEVKNTVCWFRHLRTTQIIQT